MAKIENRKFTKPVLESLQITLTSVEAGALYNLLARNQEAEGIDSGTLRNLYDVLEEAL